MPPFITQTPARAIPLDAQTPIFHCIPLQNLLFLPSWMSCFAMTLLPLSTPVAFFPPRRLLVLPFLLFASSSFTDLPMTGAPCTQAQHSGVSTESRQAQQKETPQRQVL